MRFRKIFLFLLILPLTLFLDLILYAMMNVCPACSSFTQWLQTEGALSFPIVVGLVEWARQFYEHRNFGRSV